MDDDLSNQSSPIPFLESTRMQPGRIVLNQLKLCLLLFIIYLILNLLNIGCPIKAFTGISCPGCGMTRAVLSALQLNFRAAFYFHPLFLVTPVMFLLFLLQDFISKKYRYLAWGALFFLFFTVYLYRLFYAHSDVVTIDIHSAIMLRLIKHIIA
jgi:hypothetical protein